MLSDDETPYRTMMQNKGNYLLLTDLPIKPDFLKLYCLNHQKYRFLLESVVQPQGSRCFDILLLASDDFFYLDAQRRLIHPIRGGSPRTMNATSSLAYISEQLSMARQQSCIAENDYPFAGGWFCFLAYETNQLIEPVLTSRQPTSLPYYYFARCTQALIYDHQKQQCIAFCEDPRQLSTLGKELVQDYHRAEIHWQKQRQSLPEGLLQQPAEQQFVTAIERIKDYIVEGDVFQVNLSRQWELNLQYPSHHQLAGRFYQQLRQANPAPFAALANIGQQSIISSSPERLVRLHDGMVESRPIAGTHPRGQTADEDHRLMERLHQHPKERSEHVMLIDLIRNDLGRICRPGTIEVNEFMVNESYQFVHHIVSNVRGKIADNIDAVDIIRAIFPGGTITGCPKVRCMQIIHELEAEARGAYTGSLGYINNNGSMDLNILIRTMQLQQLADKQQRLSFRAGAGIVFDSLASKEVAETGFKAKGMLAALQQHL